MTKLLAIEGTGIRLTINECANCPFDDDERGTCNLATELMMEQPCSIADPRCPLPEKPGRDVPEEERVFGGVLRRMYAVTHQCGDADHSLPTTIRMGCGCVLTRKKYVVWEAEPPPTSDAVPVL